MFLLSILGGGGWKCKSIYEGMRILQQNNPAEGTLTLTPTLTLTLTLTLT
jgi:hypothetical protein